MAGKVYCSFHLVFLLLICYLQCYYTIQMHVEFDSKDQMYFLSANSEGKFLTSAWNLFTGLMNAPQRCYYFFGVKMTS